METESKRGRGKATRGNRGRPRGRRGRGKKLEKVVSSDEEMDIVENVVDMGKENECENEVLVASTTNITLESENVVVEEEQQILVATEIQPQAILPPTIDMEADISQLEAPTFTTLSRGPPEPMLRLKWNHKVNLIGEKVLNPMIHCCDQCEKPILIYGRMIPCKHIFCLKCARTEPIKICPRCNDKVVRVEQSGLGTVFLCTHGGSRYGNTGCRRTYLSQRDLQAHINHRHVSQIPAAVTIQQQATLTLPPPVDAKPDTHMDPHKLAGSTRKLSESSTGATLQSPSALLNQRTIQIRSTSSGIGSIPPPGSGNTAPAPGAHSALTAANLARINNANAQECHQGKERLHQTLKKAPITQSHHHQPQPETVADASYYSSVLNSFGAADNTERSVRKY